MNGKAGTVTALFSFLTVVLVAFGMFILTDIRDDIRGLRGTADVLKAQAHDFDKRITVLESKSE